MILSKSPLRVTFFGGASDLPSFYMLHGGATISMAIDKYVYVALMYTPYDHIKVSYSKQEIVTKVDDLENEIIRESLKYFGLTSNIEITTFADIPTVGTGLGGSSAFTCALVAAIAEYKNIVLSTYDLAEIACMIEIKMCGHNIGKQDQYASAFGGMNYIEYGIEDGYGRMDRCLVKYLDHNNLDVSCLLIPTLIDRKPAHSVIDTIKQNKMTVDTIKEICNIARSFKDDLPSLPDYSMNLNKAWELKKVISDEITNPVIDDMYDRCMKNGAWGCKLLGAGGGGYMMAMTNNKASLKNEFNDRTCLDVKIAHEGAKVVYNG